VSCLSLYLLPRAASSSCAAAAAPTSSSCRTPREVAANVNLSSRITTTQPRSAL